MAQGRWPGVFSGHKPWSHEPPYPPTTGHKTLYSNLKSWPDCDPHRAKHLAQTPPRPPIPAQPVNQPQSITLSPRAVCLLSTMYATPTRLAVNQQSWLSNLLSQLHLLSSIRFSGGRLSLRTSVPGSTVRPDHHLLSKPTQPHPFLPFQASRITPPLCRPKSMSGETKSCA
jgi:hypothetical protein